MSLGLLLPGALLALAALVLPILLHLVRQSDRTRIEFAALRWLTFRAQPRRRPRLDEWLLLLLRLLLLALIALWLARPVLYGQPDTRPWMLVHPAIEASGAPPASTADEQRRWLAPGFPPLHQPAPDGSASVGSLLRELDATLPSNAEVTVLVPARFDATDAERPVLRRKVRWIAVPGTSAFETMKAPRPVSIAVHADAQHRQALPFLRAAIVAWNKGRPADAAAATLREVARAEAPRANDTHLLWFAASPVPAATANWVRAGGIVLQANDAVRDATNWRNAAVAWRDLDGTPLALRVPAGKGTWVTLLAPFAAVTLPALLEPDFPDVLQELLGISTEVATRATAVAYAPGTGLGMEYPQTPRPFGAWLAWVIAVLFGIERWLAASPRRRRA